MQHEGEIDIRFLSPIWGKKRKKFFFSEFTDKSQEVFKLVVK